MSFCENIVFVEGSYFQFSYSYSLPLSLPHTIVYKSIKKKEKKERETISESELSTRLFNMKLHEILRLDRNVKSITSNTEVNGPWKALWAGALHHGL